jgi:hypothetical protein
MVGASVHRVLGSHANGQAQDQEKLLFVSQMPHDAEPDRKDHFGDTLPEGAMARLGTTRFRLGGRIFGGAVSGDYPPGTHRPCVDLPIAFSPDGRSVAVAASPNKIFQLSYSVFASDADLNTRALASSHSSSIRRNRSSRAAVLSAEGFFFESGNSMAAGTIGGSLRP